MFYSFAKIKSLIVISESPLDELRMQQMQISSKDEFYLVNFVFDESKVHGSIVTLPGRKEKYRITFALSEVDKYLSFIATKQDKEIL